MKDSEKRGADALFVALEFAKLMPGVLDFN